MTEYLYTSNFSYFDPVTKKWKAHKIINVTKKNYIVDKRPWDKGALRLDREVLERDRVIESRSIYGYLSFPEHKEFFDKENFCKTDRGRGSMEDIAEDNGAYWTFRWLITEAAGKWRWENNWEFTYENMLEYNQYIYDNFAHVLHKESILDRNFQRYLRWKPGTGFLADVDGWKEEFEEFVANKKLQAFEPWRLSDAEEEAVDIIGLGLDCTLKEAKQLFRLTAQLYHPDKHQGNKKLKDLAHKKTCELNNAWELVQGHFKKIAQEKEEIGIR